MSRARDIADRNVDSTTIDGVDSTQLLRSDVADTKTAGDLSFADDVKAQFGASNDLQIYHDTTANHSYIIEGGGGDFILQGNNIRLENTSGNYYVRTFSGGAVQLYHNNSEKLATKSDGVDITGELQADSLDIDGAGDISGALAVGGQTTFTGFTNHGASIKANGQNNFDIMQNTSDGSDNKQTRIGGGGDVTDARGAFIELKGNEASGVEGNLQLNAGDVAGASVIVNERSRDTDFRVESNGVTHMLFVDGTNNRVGIGDSTPSTALEVNGTVTATGLDVNGAGDISGNLNMSGGNITLGDSGSSSDDRLVFGAGSDLQIYHDGVNSQISTLTGQLFLSSVNSNTWLKGGESGILNADGTEYMIRATSNGSVKLFYDNVQKFATTSTGIDVTGNATFDDNGKAIFGAGSDLQIYHDASESIIEDVGTGDLKVRGSDEVKIQVRNTANTAWLNAVVAADAGAVTLSHNNSAKLATTSTGVTVTGTALATTDTDTTNTGSVTLDFSTNQNFVLTLTGNVTLANPTTEQVGQSGFIVFIQDATGGRTVSLGTDYETAGGAGLTLSTAASTTDIVPYVVAASGRILLGTPQLAFA